MSKSVLIIEDDDGIRESLRDLLEYEGYHAEVARHGKEGLDLLKRHNIRPALILLDLMMPIMDGWEFLDHKTKDPEIAPIPVVVISAAGEQVKVPPANAYVKKPIHLDHFIEVMNQFLVD